MYPGRGGTCTQDRAPDQPYEPPSPFLLPQQPPLPPLLFPPASLHPCGRRRAGLLVTALLHRLPGLLFAGGNDDVFGSFSLTHQRRGGVCRACLQLCSSGVTFSFHEDYLSIRSWPSAAACCSPAGWPVLVHHAAVMSSCCYSLGSSRRSGQKEEEEQCCYRLTSGHIGEGACGGVRAKRTDQDAG